MRVISNVRVCVCVWTAFRCVRVCLVVSLLLVYRSLDLNTSHPLFPPTSNPPPSPLFQLYLSLRIFLFCPPIYILVFPFNYLSHFIPPPLLHLSSFLLQPVFRLLCLLHLFYPPCVIFLSFSLEVFMLSCLFPFLLFLLFNINRFFVRC